MPEPLVYSTFKPLLDTRFKIRAGEDGQVELLLIEVEALPKHAGAGPRMGRDPFVLLFRGPQSPTLQQGIHVMAHEVLGKAEIFLVPVEPDAGGPRYEAVFN